MAPGIWQILIIVLIVLLLFGAGRLPRLMEDLGKGIKSFKKGIKEEDGETAPPALEQPAEQDKAKTEKE